MALSENTGVKNFSAYEITLKQARELLMQAQLRADRAEQEEENKDLTPEQLAEKVAANRIADNMFEEISLHEVAVICRCSIDDLEELTESEIDKMVHACRQVNKRFFKMKAKERQQSEDMMKRFPGLMEKHLARVLERKEQEMQKEKDNTDSQAPTNLQGSDLQTSEVPTFEMTTTETKHPQQEQAES